MKRIATALSFLILAMAGISHAADTARIGYVDMRKALNECKAGIDAKAKLEKMIKEKQKFLDEEGKKIESMKSDLEKKASLLSEKAKQEKQREFQEKIQAYQKLVADAQNEINKREAEYTREILKGIKETVREIARAEGFSLILDSSEGTIVYAGEGLDLTARVIERYNAKSR